MHWPVCCYTAASQPAIDATVAVHKLFNAFCTACRTLGRVIIIEHFLAMTNPNYNKLIKSVDVGGIAGGEKFIAHGIFFKRVSDSLVKAGRPITPFSSFRLSQDHTPEHVEWQRTDDVR